MSVKETASTLEDAGRSLIDVSWKGDGTILGGCAAAAAAFLRNGGGEIDPDKELYKSIRLVDRPSSPNFGLFREGSPDSDSELSAMFAARRESRYFKESA